MENPTGKFFRLAPGREVRLRYGYFIKCHEVVNDPLTGDPIEIRCTYDPETKGGASPEGRKVKATIHWVSTQHAIQGEVRLYDRLCIDPTPDISADSNLESVLNPNSLKIIQNARLEPSLRNAKSGERFQFERLGYFCSDTKISDNEIPVFNRTVTLRDTWKKVNNSNPRS
jgi:glutaminyl-tRNA synthetase